MVSLDAMNATQVIAPDAEWNKATKQKLYQRCNGHATSLRHIRHWFVLLGTTQGDLDTHVLPVRPGMVVPGRIGQQSSCFTLHMHEAKDVRMKLHNNDSDRGLQETRNPATAAPV